MKVYLASWVEKNQMEGLNNRGVFYRLLSYYFIGVYENFLDRYVTHCSQIMKNQQPRGGQDDGR